MEFDAAQALLDLHNNIREAGPCNTRTQSQMDHTEDVVKTANLYMSCFFTSNVRVDPSSSFAETSMSCYMNQLNTLKKTPSDYTTNTTLTRENSNYYNDQENLIETSTTNSINGDAKNKDPDCKLMRSLEMILNKHFHEQFEGSQVSSNINDINDLSSNEYRKKPNLRTRDIGTQTVESNYFNNIKIMELTITHLSDRIEALESQINTTKHKSHVLKEENQQIYNERNRTSDRTPTQHMAYNNCPKKTRTSSVDKTLNQDVFPCENEDWKKENTSCKVINNVESNDLVPIGKGHALVSARLLRHINWNSYTSATRKLLTAIFSRRVLATHSLTGKRSPAFPTKQAKKKLDVDLVQDIVQTVVDRCSVPENVVRTSITTKCADESKMYRTRMLNRKLKHRRTRDKISSETSDSDASFN